MYVPFKVFFIVNDAEICINLDNSIYSWIVSCETTHNMNTKASCNKVLDVIKASTIAFKILKLYIKTLCNCW